MRLGVWFALVSCWASGCGDEAPRPPRPCVGICKPPSWTTLELVAGQPGGPGHVDGIGAAAHFDSPWTLTSDGAGHLYIADSNTIRAVDLGTLSVTTLAGFFTVGSEDGIGAAARFSLPSGVAAAPGTVYVADTENHTIRKIEVATATVVTLAGAAGVRGSDDGIGTAARFGEPEGLALDSAGNLYICDTDNHVIRKMELATGMVTKLAGAVLQAGNVDGAGAAARFNTPRALTSDGAQTLYVLDMGNLSARRVNVADGMVSTVARFSVLPQGIAVLGAELFVSVVDGRIFRVDLASGAITLAAGATTVRGFIDGAAADARFSAPAGLHGDGSGAILVADVGNYVIRKIDLANRTVSTFLGSNSAGSSDGVGSAVRFRDPEGLVADPGGVLYLADTKNHTIRQVVRSSGEVTTLAGAAGQAGNRDGARADARFNFPTGLALDPSGRLYIADSGNRLIRSLDLATGTVTSLEVSRASADEPFTSFAYPTGLALDGGALFVTDYQNHTVLSIDLGTGGVRTLAGSAGASGTSDGRGAEARLHSPLGIAADGQGNLYVADVINHTLRKIVVSTREVSTWAGRPAVQGIRDGTGGDALFDYPSYLAANGLGDLFVSDSLNNLVRRVSVQSRVVTTVIGTPARPGVAPGPLPAQIGQPWALALTFDGELALVSENSVLRAY